MPTPAPAEAFEGTGIGLAGVRRIIQRQMSAHPTLKNVPVVMRTTSREDQDLVRSYQPGVNVSVFKPVGFRQFIESVRQLGCFRAIINEPPPACAP